MDEPELGCTVQSYLHDYKLFSEKLANLLRTAAQDNIDEESETTITTLTSNLQAETERYIHYIISWFHDTPRFFHPNFHCHTMFQHIYASD